MSRLPAKKSILFAVHRRIFRKRYPGQSPARALHAGRLVRSWSSRAGDSSDFARARTGCGAAGAAGNDKSRTYEAANPLDPHHGNRAGENEFVRARTQILALSAEGTCKQVSVSEGRFQASRFTQRSAGDAAPRRYARDSVDA